MFSACMYRHSSVQLGFCTCVTQKYGEPLGLRFHMLGAAVKDSIPQGSLLGLRKQHSHLGSQITPVSSPSAEDFIWLKHENETSQFLVSYKLHQPRHGYHGIMFQVAWSVTSSSNPKKNS